MKSLILTLTAFFSLGLMAQSPLIETDQDGILNGTPNAGSQIEIDFKPGVYEIGPTQGRPTHFLIVDRYTNDPNKFLGIYFPRNLERRQKGTGQFFQIRPLRNSNKLMLSPIALDSTGNLVVMSQATTDAPVFEIARRAGSHKYPYTVIARNSKGDGIRGMRGSGRKKPLLNAYPTNDVFAAGIDEEYPDILVQGNTITISDDWAFDETFRMIPLNGGTGKIVGLQRSELDTMAEMEIAEDEFSRLAVFVKGYWDREVLITARRTTYMDKFEFTYNKNVRPGILSKLFPGRIDPKYITE